MVEWLRGDDPLYRDPVRPRRCPDGLGCGGRARLEAVGGGSRARPRPRAGRGARPPHGGHDPRRRALAGRRGRDAGLEAGESDDTDGVVALPGAASLLESLPADRWAVATSGSRRLATTRLAHGGLPLPRVLVTAEDVERGKPDPQPYLAAAAALGAEPSRCLVVEDAPAGIAAGKAAGAAVLAVTTTFAASALGAADYLAPSLAAVSVALGRGSAASSSSRWSRARPVSPRPRRAGRSRS